MDAAKYSIQYSAYSWKIRVEYIWDATNKRNLSINSKRLSSQLDDLQKELNNGYIFMRLKHTAETDKGGEGAP